jgi:DNA polymerase-1
MMEADFPSKSKPGLEADDVMGILSTWKGYLPNHEKIIVSSDKDMATIPGLHFNHDKDNEPRFITQQQADYTHLRQTLTGDTCDGYKGCPGVGPVRADRFLASPTASSANTSSAGSAAKDVRLWDRVVSVFNSKGLTEADALVQARLARILRAEDYDFVNQTVKLWTPSTTDSK